MKARTGKSMELYEVLLSRGYHLPVQEVVDEMLAILSDRTQIIYKHELEESNARWNEYLESRRNRVG